MIRTIALFTYEFFYIGVTIILVPYYRWLCKKDSEKANEFVYGIVSRWAERSLRVAGAKVEVTGIENLLPDDAPAVYVGNHQSLADTPLVLSNLGRPKGIIAKGELSKFGIFAMWMRAFGCVFVDREDPRKAAAAMREASENVESGRPMIIFAEGTRSLDGELLPFKSGAFKIAQKSKVPVVPFCIEGTGRLYEYNGKILAPGTVVLLHIMPKIDTSEYKRDDWKALPQLCEDMIKAEQEKIRAEN